MTDDAERYNRALAVVMHRKLCEHEAGHAAAALLCDLDVAEVRADFHDFTDGPPANPDAPAGYVEFGVVGGARARAIAILAGPLEEGRPGGHQPGRPPPTQTTSGSSPSTWRRRSSIAPAGACWSPTCSRV